MSYYVEYNIQKIQHFLQDQSYHAEGGNQYNSTPISKGLYEQQMNILTLFGDPHSIIDVFQGHETDAHEID